MTLKIYRVVNWDSNFETHKTRILQKIDWVPLPNRLDGQGYTEMMLEDDGAALYGAWIALLIIASRCHPRGTLIRCPAVEVDATTPQVRNLRPHDARTLARLSRMDVQTVQKMLDVAVTIDWLEIYEVDKNPAVDPAVDPALVSSTKERKKEGREGTHPPQKDTDGPDKGGPQNAYSTEFEAFWRIYPKRNGVKGKKCRAWQAWRETDGPPEDLIRAAENYAELMNSTDEWPVNGSTFLADRVWEDYLHAEECSRVLSEDELKNWKA